MRGERLDLAINARKLDRHDAQGRWTTLTGSELLSREEVGGKAYYLGSLMKLGVNVPTTLVLSATDDSIVVDDEVFAWLDKTCGVSPWSVAIRSSSAEEDTEKSSNAGRFITRLGAFDKESIASAVAQVRASGPAMAVILQPLINARFSGVAFSCAPLSYLKNEFSVAWTTGLADRLVAGEEQGEQVRIQRDGTVIQGTWPAAETLLDELARLLRTIESSFDGPVDVEWVIDTHCRLWIVQARPVVLPQSQRVALDSEEHFAALPSLVRNHSKIRLRRHAHSCRVTVAPAIAEIVSHPSHPSEAEVPEMNKAAGVSVVLLYPERVNDEIVREFSPVIGHDVSFLTRGCRRYSIRRYPHAANITTARKFVLETGLTAAWTSISITQAIWNATATGIIRRTPDCYVIDIAQGHFVPKGVVPTSTLVLSREHVLLSAVWRAQDTVYHFVDGHVITETPPGSQLRLDDDTVRRIAATFDPLFNIYSNAALEFGLVERSPHDLHPYLIDVAEGDEGEIGLSPDLINSGVLSVGRCRGRLLHVDSSSRSALDSHFHNKPELAQLNDEGVIVVAERATVDLLSYVGAPGVVGFVFGQGSVLAHLAVVIREKGLPAISLDDSAAFSKLPLNSVVTLDAADSSLKPSDRVALSEVR